MIKHIYRRLFHPFVYYLNMELKGCNSVLDLGCGRDSPIHFCSAIHSVGVELFESYLQDSKRKKIHNHYVKADITKLEFKPNSFDAIVALDLLEHLTKKEGLALIKKMEKWAKKKIIIFTPNGYLYQNGYDNNPLQMHRSGWSVEEFKNLGFTIYGMNGCKTLRGYRGKLKFKPKIFWQTVSDLIQKITYHYPEFAFQLFCIKVVR